MDGVVFTQDLAKRLMRMLVDYERGISTKPDAFKPNERRFIKLENAWSEEIPPYGCVEVQDFRSDGSMRVGKFLDGSTRGRMFWFNGRNTIGASGTSITTYENSAIGIGQDGPVFMCLKGTVGTRYKPVANSYNLEADPLGDFVEVGPYTVAYSPVGLIDIRWNEDDLTLEKTFDGENWEVVVAGSECPAE
jgi:hypothetical protein